MGEPCTTVEVWRTEVVICNIKAKINENWDFAKTIAKMLFLSVSAERILQLTISYKKVFRSTPPRTRDTSILRWKIDENHKNQ